MPRLRIVSILALVLVAGLAGQAFAVPSATAAAPKRRFPTRTIDAGEVTVTLTPSRVDQQAAVVEIALDTHAVELDMNLRKSSTLTVGGVMWPTTRYRGDGPGGHHREGTLRFRAAASPKGKMRLRIRGLPEPVIATWQI